MAAPLRIGDRDVGDGLPVFVVAEAGVNHDGSLARAHELVAVAAEAGADAVKFQTFRTSRLVTATAPRASYQAGRLGGDDTQRSMLAALELPREAWAELRDDARERGIVFLSTPFDEESLDLLLELDIPAVKIGSGDLTNHRLLERAARGGRPLLCSTGMASLGEIAEAVETVRAAGGELALLHCVSSYPAPAEQAELLAVRELRRVFDAVIGYSDHTVGTLAAVAAVALGAAIIEKHVTTDRSLPGPDHRASLEPADLAALVRDIRTVRSMLGDGHKTLQPAERETRDVARRSLAYACAIATGAVLASDDLTLMRPGTGLPTALEALVIGRRVRRAVGEGELVDLDDLES